MESASLEVVLRTVVSAIFLGILAQVVAQRFKLPAILPLLILGMGAGPSGLRFFDPGALGHVLEVSVHLGVALILFEGGLSLDLRQLRQVGGAVRNLLFLGSLATAVGAAALAHTLLAVAWPTAALFGAIVTVTGPTVIAPLLRHLVVPRKVRTILLSEGLMIDPIGAVLAYFVLQWIERAGLEPQVLFAEILTLGAVGAILGFAAGSLAILVIRHRQMSDELRNLVVLAVLMGTFLIAERQAPQSGVLAAVVMGLTVSAADIPDLSPLRVFKGQLTTLTISMLFVLLSGQLDLGAMFELGGRGLAVVGGLIFLVRPLAVLVSMPPRELDWKQKSVLGLNAPRGIVAAAVASVSAIQLRASGDGGDAAVLEGLVYLTILVTCAWSTLMAPLLPRWLGYYDDPSRRRIVLVGAHPLSALLGELFRAAGWTAVVVDGVAGKLKALRERGLRTVCGDARDAETYEEAETERDTRVLALTTNDELNVLVAELVRDEFGVEHPVVAMHQPSSEFGSQRRAWIDLFTGTSLDLPRWLRRLEDGKADTVELELDADRRSSLRSFLRTPDDGIQVLCGWHQQRPVFRVERESLSRIDRVHLLVDDEARTRLDELASESPPPPPSP